MNIYYYETDGRFDFYRLNKNKKIVLIGSFNGNEIYIGSERAYMFGDLKEKTVEICKKRGIKINLDDLFISNLKFGIKE